MAESRDLGQNSGFEFRYLDGSRFPAARRATMWTQIGLNAKSVDN